MCIKYWIFGAFVALLLVSNHSLSLWEQDEAAYAGFAYNMLQTKDFIIPQAEWSWPHRKPPFHFWCIAASYALFGENEFSTRIPSVLAILSTLMLLFYSAKKLYSEKVGLWASAVFMASLLVPLYGKISMTDATMLFVFTGCYFSVLFFLRSQQKRWLLYIWAFAAIGGLTKGPPIFITALGALGVGFLFSSARILFLKMILAVLLGLVPFFIWAYTTVFIDGGSFFKWWVDWYILKRTSETIYGQSGSFGYYFVVFLLNFFPWILFIPRALYLIGKSIVLKNKTADDWFLMGWIVFGWIIYELIPSKLPSYAFAVLPLWCLFIAQSILEIKANSAIYSIGEWILGIVFLIVSIGLVIFRGYIPFPNMDLVLWVLVAFFGIFGLGYLFSSQFNISRPLIALLFGFLFNYIVWGVALPAFEPIRNFPKTIAKTIAGLGHTPKFVYFSADYSMSSLPVYLSWSGYRFFTSHRDQYEEMTADSLQYSTHNLFMIQRRNFHSLESIPDSFSLIPIYGFISDKGRMDTFYIAERRGKKKK